MTSAIAVVAVMTLVAAGCGSDNKKADATTTTTAKIAGSGTKVGLVFDIGGRGDKSFNDSAAAGLDQAVSDLGITPKDLSPASGGENRQELLQLLTDDGYQLVFGVGFAFADGVKAVAAKAPDTKDAIIDSV